MTSVDAFDTLLQRYVMLSNFKRPGADAPERWVELMHSDELDVRPISGAYEVATLPLIDAPVPNSVKVCTLDSLSSTNQEMELRDGTRITATDYYLHMTLEEREALRKQHAQPPTSLVYSKLDIEDDIVLSLPADVELSLTFYDCIFHGDIVPMFQRLAQRLVSLTFRTFTFDGVKRFDNMLKSSRCERVEIIECIANDLLTMECMCKDSCELYHVIMNRNTFPNLRFTSEMFRGCKMLTDLSGLADLHTDAVETADSMFEDCAHLRSLFGIEKWNMERARDITRMFALCGKLEDINALRFWQAPRNKSVNGMFFKCESLGDIAPLSNLLMPQLEDSSFMLKRTRVQSLIALTSWDMSNVRDTVGMFSQNAHLTCTTGLERWKTPSLQRIDKMFSDCEKLISVEELRHLDVSNVTSMVKVFIGCAALYDLSPLYGWNVKNVKCLDGFCEDCISIVNTDLLIHWVEKLKHIDSAKGMFANCFSMHDFDGVLRLLEMKRKIDVYSLVRYCGGWGFDDGYHDYSRISIASFITREEIIDFYTDDIHLEEYLSQYSGEDAKDGFLFVSGRYPSKRFFVKICNVIGGKGYDWAAPIIRKKIDEERHRQPRWKTRIEKIALAQH